MLHAQVCGGTVRPAGKGDSPMTGSSSARVALPTAQRWGCPKGTRSELALSWMVKVRLPNLSLPL